jgi:hypothetical protein
MFRINKVQPQSHMLKYYQDQVVEIHSFMLKNFDLYVYHCSKPAYTFPMLIMWRIGKFSYLWTDVDEP